MQILAVIKKHGYRLEDVATMLGITKGSLSATINGSPNVKKLIDIALKIGCSPAEFFEDWYENEGKEQKREEGRCKRAEVRGLREDGRVKSEELATEQQQEQKQDLMEIAYGYQTKEESIPGVVVCPHCKGRFVAEITFKAVE